MFVFVFMFICVSVVASLIFSRPFLCLCFSFYIFFCVELGVFCVKCAFCVKVTWLWNNFQIPKAFISLPFSLNFALSLLGWNFFLGLGCLFAFLIFILSKHSRLVTTFSLIPKRKLGCLDFSSCVGQSWTNSGLLIIRPLSHGDRPEQRQEPKMDLRDWAT